MKLSQETCKALQVTAKLAGLDPAWHSAEKIFAIGTAGRLLSSGLALALRHIAATTAVISDAGG